MLMTAATVVEPKILKEHIAAGSVTAARVESGGDGLVIYFRIGMHERVLGVARGGVRFFQSLDGVANVLQGYGIMDFAVNTTHWVAKTMVRGNRTARASAVDDETDKGES